jgi:hypothetical protein
MTEEVIYEIKRAIMDATMAFHEDDVFHSISELLIMMVLSKPAVSSGKMTVPEFYRQMADEWDVQNGPLH